MHMLEAAILTFVAAFTMATTQICNYGGSTTSLERPIIEQIDPTPWLR